MIEKTMGKSLICRLLVAVLLFTAAATPAKADTTSLNESGILNTLAALEVMNGDTSGNLNLSSDVTRAEFTKMVVTASTSGDGAAQKTFSPYSDVTNSHWAAGYIKTARDLGLINGYLDGTFRPNNSVTLVEAVTICLKNLGYTDNDFTAGYPQAQMNLYYQLNLNDGISATTNDELTRRQCAYLIYNMLNAKTTGGKVLAEQMGYSLDASGKIDYLALLNDKLSGPYVVTGSNWADNLGFTPTTCYRNDAKSSISAIKTNDVIYYSAGMKTVWAYNKQKSGTYEAASPNRSNPESITLSGVTYQVGSSDAAYQLSTMGGHQLGEIITVLLGRDDTICGLLTSTSSGSATNLGTTEVIGVVTDSGTKSYTNSGGSSYNADYIKVLATDGSSYEYQSKTGSVGSVVKVTQSGSSTTVSRVSGKTVSGTVNSAATKIGNYTLDDNAEILDVYISTGGKDDIVGGITLHRSRLSGAKITAGDVLYCEVDGSTITKLILNDFSGDLYDYALMREVNESGASGSYTFIMDGTEQKLNSNGTSYHVEKGAVGMLKIDGQYVKMKNLESTKLTDFTSTSATSGNTNWQFAAHVQVYEYRDSEYYLSSAALVSSSTHTIRGYYDKLPSEGGRIRIVVCTAK